MMNPESNPSGLSARITTESPTEKVLHNHHSEFETIGGVLIYDELLKRFDPELVKMQFQVAVIPIGHQAATCFKTLPGRFILAHLADWSATGNKPVPVGQGLVD